MKQEMGVHRPGGPWRPRSSWGRKGETGSPVGWGWGGKPTKGFAMEDGGLGSMGGLVGPLMSASFLAHHP